MDHELSVGKVEPDDLQEVAGGVGPDREHLRRISIWLQIDDDDCVVDGVKDCRLVVAMLER